MHNHIAVYISHMSAHTYVHIDDHAYLNPILSGGQHRRNIFHITGVIDANRNLSVVVFDWK